MRLLGNAAFVWTDDDGDHVIELRVPLRMVNPAIAQTRFVRESLDLLNREVVTVGDGLSTDIVATIRHADAPASLGDMLLAGARGTTLTYIPDVDDPDRSTDYRLIEPNETAVALMDATRGFPGFEENQITVRLRRVPAAAVTTEATDESIGAATPVIGITAVALSVGVAPSAPTMDSAFMGEGQG